ncbi:MAG TPA: hypothetical protein VHK69_07280, partial [Chitinophagaceae bacterium]|nr:hypothetical protein [Chitinophagaceae bacterium]
MSKQQSLVILILVSFLPSCMQDPGGKGRQEEQARFTGTIDTMYRTKGGVFVNGYIVNISPAEEQRFQGKRVLISGKV